MSLISDALKTAQREAAGRHQAPKDGQPLLDGFFPYVSTSQPRKQRRLVPLIAISIATLALVGVVTWYIVAAVNTSPKPKDAKLAAVTPAQPTSVSTPPDSAAVVAVDSSAAVAPDEQPATAAPEPVRQPGRRLNRPAAQPTTAVAVSRASDSIVTRPTDAVVSAPPVRSVEAPSSRPDYEAQATMLFNNGDFAGARDRFQLATRFAPTARAWTNYGVTLQKLNDLAGAASAYQAAIGIDANYLEAWLYQARLASMQGDDARAIPLLDRARSINPRHAGVNAELARLEVNARNWTEARRFAEDVVRAEPSDFRGHYYLAVAADQLADTEVAVREYTAYLQTVQSAAAEYPVQVGYARSRLIQLRGKPS